MKGSAAAAAPVAEVLRADPGRYVGLARRASAEASRAFGYDLAGRRLPVPS